MASTPSSGFSPAVPLPSADRDDLISIAAIGVLAFIAADIAHEVAGHGIGLLIAGGRSGILTTTRLIHEPPFSNPGWRVFDVGGPAGNLLWASACFLAQRLLHRTTAAFRLFLWSSMSFSLLWESGYLLKCGVTGQGDGMALISGLTPVWLWRILIFAVGLLLYRGALSLMSAELHFVLSATNQQWRARLTRLLLTLCAAGGLIACAGPMLDPRGPFEMLNSGAASSFVSWFGMLALPSLFPLSGEKNAIAASPVARSIPLILFAAGAGFSYTAILGPGIRFSI